MKPVKCLLTVVSGILVALPIIVNADNADVTDSAGTISASDQNPDPACSGNNISVTLTDSGEANPTDPDCTTGEFSVTSGPNYAWSVTSGPGSISGSGSSATWSWTPPDAFDGTTNVNVKLAVTWSGTDCNGKNANWSANTTGSFSVTAHANDQLAAPAAPKPDPRKITLNHGGPVNKQIPLQYNLDGDQCLTCFVSGTAGPAMASETFESDGSEYGPSLCGYALTPEMLPQQPPSPGFTIDSIDLEFEISGEGPSAGVSIPIGYASEPTSEYYNLFTDTTGKDYTWWLGQAWKGDATPTTTSFTGTVAYAWIWALGLEYGQVVPGTTPVTNTYTGQNFNLLNPTAHVYQLLGTLSQTNCCPNNSH